MSLPTCAIVVVGYESTSEWPGFFESLQGSETHPAAIIVVDNSPDLSLSADQWPSLPLTVIHAPGNEGYGAAANRGVSHVPPDVSWVVVCNPDVRFFPDTLEALLSQRDVFPSTGVLGPRILTASGDTYPSARAIPGIRIGIGHALLSKLWPTNLWTKQYLGDYEGREPRSVGWLSGAFLLLDREVFRAISGFDEDFFMFFEDVDLGNRIKQAGYRNVYVPTAQVSHSGAHATAAHEKKMLLAHHHSAEIFLNKLYRRPLQWPLRALLTLGLRLRAWLQTRSLS